MKYQDFAKDYEVNYVPVPGKNRLRAVRVYTGPYFRFVAPPERIRFCRWYYLILLGILAILLLIPMFIDCSFTRAWFIQVPAAAAWIPWVLSAGAVWRLWTAKEKVEREHCELLYNRMSSSSLFLIIFCGISLIGCFIKVTAGNVSIRDWIVGVCCVASAIASVLIFLGRKDLTMVRIDDAVQS